MSVLNYESKSPTPPAPKAVFKILFLIVMVDMLGTGILIPLLPFYALHFNATYVQTTLLLSVYSACQFIATPILGAVSDRVGRRPVLVFSQLGSVCAWTMLGLATCLDWGSPTVALALIYISRVIDGISGGNVSAAQAYVSDIVHGRERAKYMGMLGAAFGIGFTLGPAMGGLLGHFNASLPAFVAGGFSLTAATLSYLRLPESWKPGEQSAKWTVARAIALVRHPVLAGLSITWFLSMTSFVVLEAVFAMFMKDRFQFRELGVGMIFTLAGITIIIVQGRLIGPLTRRFGEWNLAIIGPILVAVAMLLVAQSNFVGVAALLVVAILFNATGRSLQTPTMNAIVSHQAPPEDQGAAFGLFQGAGSFARIFSPAIAGLMFERSRSLPFFVAAGISVLASIVLIVTRGLTDTNSRALDPVASGSPPTRE